MSEVLNDLSKSARGHPFYRYATLLWLLHVQDGSQLSHQQWLIFLLSQVPILSCSLQLLSNSEARKPSSKICAVQDPATHQAISFFAQHWDLHLRGCPPCQPLDCPTAYTIPSFPPSQYHSCTLGTPSQCRRRSLSSHIHLIPISKFLVSLHSKMTLCRLYFRVDSITPQPVSWFSVCSVC